MHTTRTIASAAAAAITAITAAGCSSTATTGSDDANTIAPIGYSALFLQDPAQAAMVSAFKDLAGDTEVLSPTSANGDAGQQDTDIRNLVTAGAKSLMVIPADPAAVVPAINYARSRSVSVVSLMLGPSGGQVDISLQVDNYDVGVQACEYLAAKVGDNGTVLAIQGDMRQQTAQDRDAGFTECMSEQHPGIEVIVKTGGQWDPATAASSAAAVLAAERDLGGIFMASDGYVQPVAEVIKQQQRDAPASQDDHVWTVAVDGTPAALDAIRSGDLDADLAQPVLDFVKYGLRYLDQAASDQEVAVGPTDHGSEVIETEDGYLADVFPAELITADNVDDPGNWANTLDGDSGGD